MRESSIWPLITTKPLQVLNFEYGTLNDNLCAHMGRRRGGGFLGEFTWPCVWSTHVSIGCFMGAYYV